MASNKQDKKLYARFDGSGRIIAGSSILRKSKPKIGNWKEIPSKLCCNGPVSVNCNNFWINQTFNPENEGGVWATGSGIDSQCNTFIVMVDYWTSPNNPNQSSDQNLVLQKFNDAGDLVWSKPFDFEESGTTFNWIDVQTMIVDKEDNPICFPICYNSGSPNAYVTGIIKFDNNGNQLWSKSFLSENFQQDFVNSVVFDASNNIYFSSRATISGTYRPVVRKISTDGVVLASKIVQFDFNSYEAYINVNSAEEVYLVAKTNDNGKQHIIKLDSSLNEIWHKSFVLGSVWSYGVALDKEENIVFQVGNGAGTNPDPLYGAYVKMSPAGDIIWTTRISNVNNTDYSLGTYQLNSDADGNVYISSFFPAAIPNYPGTNNSLIVAKLSTAGAFEWAYFIQPPSGTEIDSWYWYSPIAGTVKNNSLVLGCYDNTDPFNAQLFKLPLTPVADGSYGPYTVTNITADWSTSSPALTLDDDTTTYIDAPVEVGTLTYVTFEGNYTTIHIPL